jgi:hypothetical protein
MRHLDDDVTAETTVMGAVDLGHATGAEGSAQLVTTVGQQ